MLTARRQSLKALGLALVAAGTMAAAPEDAGIPSRRPHSGSLDEAARVAAPAARFQVRADDPWTTAIYGMPTHSMP